MVPDLRVLAVILDAGHEAANRFQAPGDAALVAALSAMTEMAVHYARHPDGGGLFPIAEEFERVAGPYHA